MNEDMARRIRIASEVLGAVFSARALVTELRKGRRMHAGRAALQAIAAIVGTVIAIRDIDEVDDVEGDA